MHQLWVTIPIPQGENSRTQLVHRVQQRRVQSVRGWKQSILVRSPQSANAFDVRSGRDPYLAKTTPGTPGAHHGAPALSSQAPPRKVRSISSPHELMTMANC